MSRVVIVEDQTLVREGIVRLLSLSDRIEVIGEAPCGKQGIEVVTRLQPDVVLSDIRMPDISGIQMTRALREKGIQTPVLLLTTFHERESIEQAQQAGAQGYLLKNVSLDQLVSAIELVNSGATIFPNPHQDHPDRVPPPGGSRVPELPKGLTEREVVILKLVAFGASNREIADTLNLKEGTVKNYVSSILAKLGVRDRTQAALLANDAGWFE